MKSKSCLKHDLHSLGLAVVPPGVVALGVVALVIDGLVILKACLLEELLLVTVAFESIPMYMDT
uniref:Uncharacterized protein n=1 Tax=Magallana gigas TaxID=29159 RepID=K1QHT2_MAGGI